MRLLSYILIAFISQSACAQTLDIHYETVYDGTSYNNQLLINDTVSIWDIIPTSDATDKVDELLIKKYVDSSVMLLDYIFQKKFYVSDSLHPMKWELLSDQKEILGYQCHSAKTYFRGRTYTAYYANDLPYTGGPWKFGGLPGLILEVHSLDDIYQFRATIIQDGSDIHLSEFDLHENDQISWQHYCHQVIRKLNQHIQYMQSVSNNPGSQVHLHIERPEIIYPLAQTGQGISSQ